MPSENIRRHQEEVVYVRSIPKIFCAFPLLLYCIIAGILVALVPSEGLHVALGFIFTMLLMGVLLILSVDAKVATFVITILLLAVFLLIALVISLTWCNVLTPMFTTIYWLCSFASSPRLFVSCAIAFTITFAASWLETRTTVYEIRPNEIVRRRSFFGFGATEIGRFDADRLVAVFTKMDICEFFLLRVGRLEIWAGNEKQAFVIEHFPARLVPQIHHILAANEVRVDPDR